MRGLLLFGDTERSAALRHEIPIPISDPLLFADVDGRRYVLTSHLERARVERALPDAEVLDYFALGYKELVERGLSIADAGREPRVTRCGRSASKRRSSPAISRSRSATACGRTGSS